MSAQSNDRSGFPPLKIPTSRFSDTRLHLNPKRTEMLQFFCSFEFSFLIQDFVKSRRHVITLTLRTQPCPFDFKAAF
jgi:hypothetical protein